MEENGNGEGQEKQTKPEKWYKTKEWDEMTRKEKMQGIAVLLIILLLIGAFIGGDDSECDGWGTERFPYGSAEALAKCLATGIDPKVQDEQGSSPLIYAATGESKAVRLLLEAGADPNVQNQVGRTALMQAASFKGWHESVRLLLEAGANPNVQDQYGESALTAANIVREKFRLLLEAGANPNAQNQDGETALMNVAIFLAEQAARIGAEQATRTGSLDHELAQIMRENDMRQIEETKKIVRLLLKAGANPNARNKDGKTADMLANEAGKRTARIFQ